MMKPSRRGRSRGNFSVLHVIANSARTGVEYLQNLTQIGQPELELWRFKVTPPVLSGLVWRTIVDTCRRHRLSLCLSVADRRGMTYFSIDCILLMLSSFLIN
jgi:hypothetical protein